MIKYKITVGDVTTELECQTIDELIKYLNYDRDVAEREIPVYDPKTDSWVDKSFYLQKMSDARDQRLSCKEKYR